MTLPAKTPRRRALACLALVSVGWGLGLQQVRAQGKETFLPTPTSLRAAALVAQSKSEPLVLLVSLPGCPWCELLRRNYLAPMRLDGLQAYQITVNDRSLVVADFTNQANHGAGIAEAFQAKLTPTVLFLSADGTELAPRIEGVASVDLVGALLNARLLAARAALRAGR